MITWRFTGVAEEVAKAERLREAWRQKIAEALIWFGKTASEAMVADHPYRDRTGWLTASTGYTLEPLGPSGPIMLRVFALASYADLVENGTPRSRPYPFFYPKFYQYLPELLDRLQRSLDEAYQDVAA